MEAKDLLDKKVLIIGDHPHKGKTGRCTGTLQTLVGVGINIQLDDGCRCTVFDITKIQVL